MKHMNTRQSNVSPDQLVVLLGRLGRDRCVKRQALQDVTDELRLVVVRASAAGVPDAQIARAAEVAVTTVRQWLGKGNDGQRDSHV